MAIQGTAQGVVLFGTSLSINFSNSLRNQGPTVSSQANLSAWLTTDQVRAED